MNRSGVRLKWFLCACGQLLLPASACFAQSFTQRGFLETDLLGYPQTAAGDSGRAVGGAILDYDATYKLSHSFIFSGGIEARTDTHHEVDREFGLSYWDRETARPAFSIRSLNATYTKGLVTVELGKQFVRWGKADILNPTDRFAPQDYVDVVNSEFLGITAARLTIGDQSNTAEFVWAPRFTPSRIPLLGQRWVVIPALPFNAHPPVLDGGAQIPGGQQFGARWNHIGQVAEFSFSFYEGYNHLPWLIPPLCRASPRCIYSSGGVIRACEWREPTRRSRCAGLRSKLRRPTSPRRTRMQTITPCTSSNWSGRKESGCLSAVMQAST